MQSICILPNFSLHWLQNNTYDRRQETLNSLNLHIAILTELTYQELKIRNYRESNHWATDWMGRLWIQPMCSIPKFCMISHVWYFACQTAHLIWWMTSQTYHIWRTNYEIKNLRNSVSLKQFWPIIEFVTFSALTNMVHWKIFSIFVTLTKIILRRIKSYDELSLKTPWYLSFLGHSNIYSITHELGGIE